MKYLLFVFFSFLLTNVLYSQKRIDIQIYSQDTLTILNDFTLIGLDNKKEKFDLLNSFDSTYIFLIDSLNYKQEFVTDGEYLNVFLFKGTIDKYSDCKWIEIKKIKLKKHCIFLKLLINNKNNHRIISSLYYEYKILFPKKSNLIVNDFYAPKYKLLKIGGNP